MNYEEEPRTTVAGLPQRRPVTEAVGADQRLNLMDLARQHGQTKTGFLRDGHIPEDPHTRVMVAIAALRESRNTAALQAIIRGDLPEAIATEVTTLPPHEASRLRADAQKYAGRLILYDSDPPQSDPAARAAAAAGRRIVASAFGNRVHRAASLADVVPLHSSTAAGALPPDNTPATNEGILPPGVTLGPDRVEIDLEEFFAGQSSSRVPRPRHAAD